MIIEFKYDECFEHIMKCEDHFHDHNVFQAGFGSTPRKSSIMAYGTIIVFPEFDKSWELIKDDYSVNCWEEMSKYWVYQSYLSPIPLILAHCIYDKLGLDIKGLTYQV